MPERDSCEPDILEGLVLNILPLTQTPKHIFLHHFKTQKYQSTIIVNNFEFMCITIFIIAIVLMLQLRDKTLSKPIASNSLVIRIIKYTLI